MSAELLREAADGLRALADRATQGKWRVGAEGSEGSRVNPCTGDKWEDCRYIAAVNGRSQPQDGANARLIAALGPDFARDVADLLDRVVADLDRDTHRVNNDYEGTADLDAYQEGWLQGHPAVALARTFLGRQS